MSKVAGWVCSSPVVSQLYPDIIRRRKGAASTRRGQPDFFGMRRPDAGAQPVPYVPQLAISALPPALHHKIQRFSGTDVDQQIDHFTPPRPKLGHKTSLRRARVDRIDTWRGEEFFGYLVDEQRARRIFRKVRVERGLPGICHRPA